MKRLITALMTAALLYGCTSGRRTVAPVNPEASPEARQLLEFLYSIRGKYTLAGQHNFISDPRRYDSVVYSVTGKRPVVWGSDFSFNALGGNIADYHHCGPMNLTSPWGECRINGLSTETLRQNLVDEIKQRHAEGRIITLMWHCCLRRGFDLDLAEPPVERGLERTHDRRDTTQYAVEKTDGHRYTLSRTTA